MAKYNNQDYICGQGETLLARIDPVTKLPIGQRFIGNVPNGGLTWGFKTTAITHEESYTGRRLRDLRIESTLTCEGQLQLENFNKENLAAFLYGESRSVESGSVTGEAHTVFTGGTIQARGTNLSALTVTGGTAGTDYEIVDLRRGLVRVLKEITDEEGEEWTLGYTTDGYEETVAFSTQNQNYWLTFSGINNADGNKPVVCDFFKVRFDPADSFDMITDKVTMMQMNFEALYEPVLDVYTEVAGPPVSYTAGPTSGGFFRMQKPTANPPVV